ncbi:hypothetical protein G6F38_007870 [Rhizopus arrhizus]|nr:hypothetical protein G6F38_007870 [Rhizopus arrhizus]
MSGGNGTGAGVEIGKETPLNSESCKTLRRKGSKAKLNNTGERGSPCQRPRNWGTEPERKPLTLTRTKEESTNGINE